MYKLRIFLFFSLYVSCYKTEDSKSTHITDLSCNLSHIQFSNGQSSSYIYDNSGNLIKFGDFSAANNETFDVTRDSVLKINSNNMLLTFKRNKDTIKCIKIIHRAFDTSVLLYYIEDNLIKNCYYKDKQGNVYKDSFEYKDKNLVKYINSFYNYKYTYEYYDSTFFKDTIQSKSINIKKIFKGGETEIFMLLNEFFKLDYTGNYIGKYLIYNNNILEMTFELFKNKSNLNNRYFFTRLFKSNIKSDTALINLNCY